MGSRRESRILIVDDNTTIHEDFWRILCPDRTDDKAMRAADMVLFGEEAGPRAMIHYDLDFATTGEQALERVEQSLADGRPYAVAFIDVRMPGGWDGVETLGRIWQKHPELQAVLCTAFSDYSWEAIIEQVRHPENLLILKKPFETIEVAQMASMLTRKWMRHHDTQHLACPLPNRASAPRQKLLVLEDEQLTRNYLERKLREKLPDVDILTAQTLLEAQLLLTEGKIDFFLLDIVLPDGNGIDFVSDVQMMQPDALVVLMTARSLGSYREAVDRLGTLRFLQKPINVEELVAQIRERQQAAEEAATKGGACSFAATLTRLTPVDIIQLKCIGGATTTLDFYRADGAHGRLCFERGDIIHAETGEQRGEAAFTEVMNWRSGRVEETADEPSRERTIHQPWQALLLSAVHQIDEQNEAATS